MNTDKTNASVFYLCSSVSICGNSSLLFYSAISARLGGESSSVTRLARRLLLLFYAGSI